MKIPEIKITNIIKKNHDQKLKFKPADFYVRIRGYGKNKAWANEIIKTADCAADLIQRETSGENVLKIIVNGVKKANLEVLEISKKFYTGLLRTTRNGWITFQSEITTKYQGNRYKIYEKRLDNIKNTPIKAPQKGLGISKPIIYNGTKKIIHGDSKCVNLSLDYVLNLYQNLFPKYLNKALTQNDLEDINSTIAEIRWVLAHATPWMRGSDAISNVFTRAIYKALGIKTTPLKKGISLDLEAYCTPLEDYKLNFINYFEKPPKIVNKKDR